MSAPSASTEFARGVGIDACGGFLRGCEHPAHGILFVHARQFDHAAVLAESFVQALEAVLVVHLHAARVGRDAQEVGDEEQQRLRVGRTEVAIERGELFFFCTARVELPHIANEDHLKRRHQRRRLRAVKHVEDRGLGEVEIGEAEIAKIGGHKGL